MIDEYMWQQFTQSGNICDYLVYKELSVQDNSEIETPPACELLTANS